MKVETNIYTIMLSDIRDMIGGDRCSFICNAALLAIFKNWDNAKGKYVCATDTYRALHEQYPSLFKELNCLNESSMLGAWLNYRNLPNRLNQDAYNRLECSYYRLELLNWILSKHGDRMIDITVETRFTEE